MSHREDITLSVANLSIIGFIVSVVAILMNARMRQNSPVGDFQASCSRQRITASKTPLLRTENINIYYFFFICLLLLLK
jgi:hypothetical protein